MRGSVYKRCPDGISGRAGKPACRKEHGTWCWAADGELVGRRRKQVYGSGYRTRSEAENALADHLNAVAAGTWSDDEGMTVETWLNTWLEQCEKTLEPGTMKDYRSHVRRILVPQIGGIRLKDLRRKHVEDMFARVAVPEPALPQAADRMKVRCTAGPDETKTGRPCGRWANHGWDRCPRHGGGDPVTTRPNSGRVVERRSPATIDSYRRTLRAALAAAVRRDLITRNPAEGRIDSIPARQKPQTAWWEPEEVATFLTSVASDPNCALYELAAFGGLRRGELLGLRWIDVDLTSATPGVTIRQTLGGMAGDQECYACGKTHRGRRLKLHGQATATGRVQRGAKSDAGLRWVPLVGGTIRELLAHQAAQEAEAEKVGPKWSDHSLVFPIEDGSPARPSSVTKRFDRLAAAVGLPKIRLHDQRHGAASLMIAAGVPVETVALILGHNPAVTRSTYMHVMKGPASAGMKAAMALVRGEKLP